MQTITHLKNKKQFTRKEDGIMGKFIITIWKSRLESIFSEQ